MLSPKSTLLESSASNSGGDFQSDGRDPLREPLDHLDRDLLAAPSVLQDQLAGVVPDSSYSLEPDLLVRLLGLDGSREAASHGTSAR